MKRTDRKKLLELYEGRYARFGYDVKTVGWKDKKTQHLRFDVLAGIADLSGCSICDLGCGFGDLYTYLLKKFKKVNYLGIDLSGKLIEEAKIHYPDAVFMTRDILKDPLKKKVDYILSSGALSFKIKNHGNYVWRMFEAMMAMSLKGVAVNFLSSYVDYKLEKNFHFSPERAFKMGRELTPYVTIRHDYPLYEFTLYLYHYPPRRDKNRGKRRMLWRIR